MILIMYSNYIPSQKHIHKLRHITKLEVKYVSSEEEAIRLASQAVIVLGHRYLKQILPYAKNLKWIQTTSNGYDHLPMNEINSREIVISRFLTSSGVIAQHAVMLALALNRKLFDCINSQNKNFWNITIYNKLHSRPRIALILGFGQIGKAIAKIMKSMDIEVWAVKQNKNEESISLSDRLFTDNTWIGEVHKIDFCFLALPNTASTKNILSKEVLNKMSSKTIIVNIARGELIDMTALCSLLKEGKIGGAGIDVFNQRKPLQEDSFIWDTPNLIVTPYLAARYADRGYDLEQYIESQVQKYFSSKKVINIIENKTL